MDNTTPKYLLVEEYIRQQIKQRKITDKLPGERNLAKELDSRKARMTVEQYLTQARASRSFLLDLSKIDRDRLYADLSERFPPVFGLAIVIIRLFPQGLTGGRR